MVAARIGLTVNVRFADRVMTAQLRRVDDEPGLLIENVRDLGFVTRTEQSRGDQPDRERDCDSARPVLQVGCNSHGSGCDMSR